MRANHRLRAMREIVNGASEAPKADFGALHARLGRQSNPPEKLLRAVLAQPKVRRLISSNHFSVDGTLIEVWAPTRSMT